MKVHPIIYFEIHSSWNQYFTSMGEDGEAVGLAAGMLSG